MAREKAETVNYAYKDRFNRFVWAVVCGRLPGAPGRPWCARSGRLRSIRSRCEKPAVKKRLFLPVLLSLSAGLFNAGPALGEPTPLRILVRADDAKFIGSGVGGLSATVRDAETGRLLGSGRIEGGTGDTGALMSQPARRGDTAVTPDSASLSLVLDIERPTRIEVEVTGPRAVLQGRQRLETSLWLLPGQDRATTPLVLHLNGLLVDLAALVRGDDGLSVTAEVSMLCGCTISKDGPWPADDYAVTAVIYRDGEVVARAPLAFTGETSRFAGALPPVEGEGLLLELQALQRSTGNAGVYREPLSR